MSDLVIFAGLVGLVVAVGISVGMIVAGRIDPILARRPAPAADARAGQQGGAPVTDPTAPADTVETRS